MTCDEYYTNFDTVYCQLPYMQVVWTAHTIHHTTVYVHLVSVPVWFAKFNSFSIKYDEILDTYRGDVFSLLVLHGVHLVFNESPYFHHYFATKTSVMQKSLSATRDVFSYWASSVFISVCST